MQRLRENTEAPGNQENDEPSLWRVVDFVLIRFALLQGFFHLDSTQVVDVIRRRQLGLRRVLGRQRFVPPLNITHFQTGDGGGAQLQAAIATYVFARSRALDYVKFGFDRIEHGSGCGDWESKWDALLRFPCIAGPNQTAYCIDTRKGIARAFFLFRSNDVFSSRGFRRAADENPELFHRYRKEILEMWATGLGGELSKGESDQGVLTVHIRRGDVNSSQYPYRFTENKKILENVKIVRSVTRVTRVIVVTDGLPEELGDLRSYGWEILEDLGALEALATLVSASNLLMAKSSFSYVAGILCQGNVFYERFWHPPLASWVALDEVELG